MLSNVDDGPNKDGSESALKEARKENRSGKARCEERQRLKAMGWRQGIVICCKYSTLEPKSALVKPSHVILTLVLFHADSCSIQA
jgi:hypothetical protein